MPRPANAEAAKPNIVFILMDNLGYGELGVYGGGITRGASTPRIDHLAAEGNATDQLQRRGIMYPKSFGQLAVILGERYYFLSAFGVAATQAPFLSASPFGDACA